MWIKMTSMSLAALTLTAGLVAAQPGNRGRPNHPGQNAPPRPIQNTSRPAQVIRPPMPVNTATFPKTVRPPVMPRTINRPTTNTQRPVFQQQQPTSLNRPKGNSPARLPLATNTALINLANSGKIGPRTIDAIRAVEKGELLNSTQQSYLEGALLKNSNLTASERAAIGTALQNDKDEKRRLASANQPPVIVPIMTSPLVGQGTQSVITVAGATPAGGNWETPVWTGGADSPPATAPSYGLKITSIYAGPASDAGLRPGDVITTMNGVSIPSIAVSRQVLESAAGQVEVNFISSATGAPSTVTLTPQEGRMGIEGESVPLN